MTTNPLWSNGEYTIWPDWNTWFMPFPEWPGPIDEEGRWLVKPSWPQQKKTFWKPGPDYFQGQNKPKESTQTIKWGPMGMVIDEGLIMDASEVVGLNKTWIRAVHKLESNAYRINQDLLQVVNAMARIRLFTKCQPELLTPLRLTKREKILR